jgi:hypothetical protein
MVGIIVLGISSASAIGLPKADDVKPILQVQNSEKLAPNSVGYTFSGMYAKKNESGYVVLGSLEGEYNMSSNTSGTFEGLWNTTGSNITGTFSGWYWGWFFMGQMQQDNTSTSNWFIGLQRVNATTNEFYAVMIIFGSSHMIRYAAGTYT